LDIIVSFSAEMTGKEITKLAKHPKVRWISADAPMVSTTTPSMDAVSDNFTSASYSGNNGTASWGSNWLEGGETTNATSGLIQAVSNSACAGGSGYCLRLDPYTPTGAYIYRQANLSGMVSVWLSFYRNNQLNANSGGSSEQVQLQVSANGGTSWTTLQTYSGNSNIGAATDSFDISAYASSNMRIRLLMPTYQSGARYIYFDDIQIAYAKPSAFRDAVRANALASSMTGTGVTVAVIDSGITTFHPDFTTGGSSRVIANEKFGNNLTTEDMYGHGTHVAGIIGGNGTASGGTYKGIAPGVNLVNLKTSDMYGMTYESDVVAGLQWIYDNKSTYNIKVVNISMNSTVAQSYHTSPLDAAVEILWFNGIVVVVSAGNNGTANGSSTLYPPANDPFVITVGASEDKGTGILTDDTIAVFSAYGTTESGFAKPDIVAPGRNVVAPLGGLINIIFQQHPLHRVNDYYFRMSGTSMSAPVVSGAVALLLQDEPNLTPDQVKYRLMNTANKTWTNYSTAKAGAGALDIYTAVNGTSTQSANTGIVISQMLSTGSEPITWGSVGWNSVGWNSVGWNSVGWNSVGWNSVGWNSVGWNSGIWDEK
jgi:serine protease AprX